MTTEQTPEIHRRESDVSPRMARRIRIAGVFLLLGMGVEVISLIWSHPTSFLLYLTVGGLFILLGLAAYLFSLVFTH